MLKALSCLLAGPFRVSLLTAGGARAAFTPIVVTGYNEDTVVEAGASSPLTGAVTATMDDGTANGSTTWYQQGLNTDNTALGPPAPGTTITSVNASDHQYTFPSSYSTSDTFDVGQGAPSPTMTLTAPAKYSALYFLVSAGHGPLTVNYTVSHADGTMETGSNSVPDWFNNNSTVAFIPGSRVDVGSGALSSGTNEPASLGLIGAAALGLRARRRRAQRA